MEEKTVINKPKEQNFNAFLYINFPPLTVLTTICKDGILESRERKGLNNGKEPRKSGKTNWGSRN